MLAGVPVVTVSWAPALVWIAITRNIHAGVPVVFILLSVAGSICGGAIGLLGTLDFIGHALRSSPPAR